MSIIKSVNPFSEQVLKEIREHEIQDLDIILQKADQTFQEWRKTTFSFRKERMQNCAKLLQEQKASLAELITIEMGKPILQSIAEVEKCAYACSYFADHAEKFLENEYLASDASESYIRFEPLGCVLAIMPWNFPLWQVFRFAAPALMAGNVGILKHASNVPQCSMAIERIFSEAGFPEGAFQSAIISSSKVEYLISSPVVKAVTLTGSEKAGADVAAKSGLHIKKTVLELGGSDCFIVLKDADLGEAADVAVRSRLINNGQSCIAAKRFIIEEPVYDEFLSLLKEKLETLQAGDPLDPKTDIGPLARKDLAESLHEQVQETINKGGEVFYQWNKKDLKFPFFKPVILTNIRPGMSAYEEEFFGPVFICFSVKSEAEAVSIANDSKYGLGGSIWTGDVENGKKIAGKVEAGAVFVNGLVKSDPRLPFGGIKYSGYGRELSLQGIREFVNQKTVWIK